MACYSGMAIHEVKNILQNISKMRKHSICSTVTDQPCHKQPKLATSSKLPKMFKRHKIGGGLKRVKNRLKMSMQQSFEKVLNALQA